jgi:hypothetical protein
MTEGLDNFLGLVIFFSPCIAAFALVTFLPLRQLRQPVRLFVIGLANGAIAAFLSVLGMLRGMISSRLLLFIVGVSIVIGAFHQPSGFIRIDQSKEKRRTRKEK